MMKEKIYLLPGLMTDHRLWHRLEPHLEEYELIHTPIPLNEDFDEMVEYLHENIKCESINLLGFSLGGYVASYFAIKYPKKVKRLFLVGSTPSATEQKDIPKREKILQDARNNIFFPLQMQKAKELLEIKEDESLAHTMVSMFNDLGHKPFVSQLSNSLKRVELFDELIDLNFPIKFFYSTEDRLLNHKSIQKYLKKDHNIEFVSRVGTSHNIPLEVPTCLSREIKSWMSKH